MKLTGFTPAGDGVVNEIFTLYDTHGLPLDVILGILTDWKILPDWVALYKDALKAGWSSKRALIWIESGVRDSLHPHADEICKRLVEIPAYLEKKKNV
jgi:hypothetical protein